MKLLFFPVCSTAKFHPVHQLPRTGVDYFVKSNFDVAVIYGLNQFKWALRDAIKDHASSFVLDRRFDRNSMFWKGVKEGKMCSHRYDVAYCLVLICNA